MKLNNLLQKILTLTIAAVGIIALVVLNYSIIVSWFGKNGPANIGSIEVSYISMGKFLVDFGLTSWAPFWYFGFPFHLFYTPLLPMLEAVLHTLFQFPFWSAYRFITGWGYILAPVSVFFLGWQLSKKVSGGIIAGVLFSVLPTVFYFFVPGVYGDRISLNFLDPRRFTILLRWGEGPHILSLVFMPLVGVFYHRLLEKPTFWRLLTVSLFVALTALTNAIGLFSAILLILVMSLVKLAHAKQTSLTSIGVFVMTGVTSFGLVSFWYNLTFIKTFFGEGGSTGQMYMSLFPWGWIGIGVAFYIIYLLLQRVITNFAVAVSLVWFLLFFSIVTVYYQTASAYQAGIELLPQALRYNVEVDLSLALFIAVFVTFLITKLSLRGKIFEVVHYVLAVVTIIFSFVYIQPFIATAHKSAATSVDLSKTAESEIAQWLDQHVDQKKAERVFVPGNYSFYLNWFTYVPQLRGGLFQADLHHWPEDIYYQLAHEKNRDLADAWLRISNISYAVVTRPGTRELYNEIKVPQKFEGYEKAYDALGDTIYKIPLKKPSLAKVVSLSDVKSLSTPKKADDKARILSYLSWLENSSSSVVALTANDNEHYEIVGNVKKGEGIVVQMTMHSGWHAYDTVSNKSLSLKKDPLNFILIEPDSEGQVHIQLTHGRSWQEYFGYMITIITLGIIGYIAVVKRGKISIALPEYQNDQEKKEG